VSVQQILSSISPMAACFGAGIVASIGLSAGRMELSGFKDVFDQISVTKE